MKRIFVLPLLVFLLQTKAQSDWNQILRYDLHAKYNPAEKSLEALMKLQYINRSPDTLTYIWFQLWPNAYRNDKTLYSEQLLENGDTRFYFSSKDQKGYLNSLSFRVNGTLAKIQDHPEFIDVVKLILPKALLPGDSISISSSFHLRLPFNFNGNGFNGRHIEFRNWYPEPAVYDKDGWHPMPLLLQGGAYHERADYEVQIEIPPAFRIAAGAFADTLLKSTEKNLYHFSLKNANAFAWIADTRFNLLTDSLTGLSGGHIRLQYFYMTGAAESGRILTESKKIIEKLSGWLTEYPRTSISIIQSDNLQDQDFAGMVCISPSSRSSDWQTSLRSGFANQWFQTILLTDQRNQPWFSKGLVNYYEQRLTFPEQCTLSKSSNRYLWLRVAEKEHTVQPISTAAPEFTVTNDSLIAATKAGLWFSILQDSIGCHSFDQKMQTYFSIWSFKHPRRVDFQMILDSGSGKNLQTLFNKLEGTGSLFETESKQVYKPTLLFSALNTQHYNYIGLSPVPGYNQYDGFMLGALIHNINLPENRFEFLFTPMYAFGSKTMEGLGRISFTWRTEKKISRITAGINVARFDTDKATDSTGSYLFANFAKMVPYIRIDFKPVNPRSSIHKWIDLKTYLITEKNYDIPSYSVSSKDSLHHPNALVSDFYYVNQLSLNLEDSRTLYPFDLRLELQQSEMFYRINFKANYFMNYSDGGGLQVRFFASKFGAWNINNSEQLIRFQPKLLGVTGEEDYLYEDYFVGRSASYAREDPSIPNGGLPAQQIMNRDGGLKLRLDEIDYVQGRSANWVSSLNFSSSLPSKLFPFPVPVKLFFDVGTYAEAWQINPPTSRFLYVGGIQLSLFRNLLNIYAPLIYSSDVRDALGTTSFGRKITFSIDIQHINYKKMIRKIADHDQ